MSTNRNILLILGAVAIGLLLVLTVFPLGITTVVINTTGCTNHDLKVILGVGDAAAQKIVIPEDVTMISQIKIYHYSCGEQYNGKCKVGLSKTLTTDEDDWTASKICDTPIYGGTSSSPLVIDFQPAVEEGETYYIILKQTQDFGEWSFANNCFYTDGSAYAHYSYQGIDEWTSYANSDAVFKVYTTYDELVQCYRCEGSTVETADFPEGATCGSGVASEYPYSTPPDCTETITCYQCKDGASISEEKLGTVCPSGWFPTAPTNCANTICWKCNEANTPTSKSFTYDTICGQGDAATYPYTTEPSCESIKYDVVINSYDQDKNVLPDCEIRVDGNYVTNTGATAEATIQLTGQLHSIEVKKTDYTSWMEQVDISSDTQLDAILLTTTPDGFIVKIIVSDSKNWAKLVNAQVTLDRETKLTDSTGMALFTVDEEGTYTATIEVPGYTSGTATLTVDEAVCPNGLCEQFNIDLVKIDGGDNTPGFELLTLVIAIGVAFIILKRGKK